MDVTYNNVLESTRQYFQGVPPAAAGVNHGSQHPGGGGGGALGLYSNHPPGNQPQTNGPSNYYHHAHHPAAGQQRHGPPQQQQQPVQQVPSYLTNGGVGSSGKNMYNSTPQPSPSPQETCRLPPAQTSNKPHYNPHPQASPSPQDHRLASGSSKSMYNHHPQASPSPQDNIRLPSMSPFNNMAYHNQFQQPPRNRHTPQTSSPLPSISQLKAPSSASSQSPVPATPGNTGNYQRHVNGGAGVRYGPNSNLYYHQNLLQQQHELQQHQQQLQQQLHQEELKQQLQQAFYSGMTNSSRQPQNQHHQPHHPPTQHPSANQPSTHNQAAPTNPNLNQPTRSSTNSNVVPGGVKRESPLDLSVKTVRQSADSTGQMENSSSDAGTTYYYFQQEGVRGHPPLNPANIQQQSGYQSYATLQPATTPKVDFSPNFSQHAHMLHNHPQQQQQHLQHPHQHLMNHHPQAQTHHQQSSAVHHQQMSQLHHQQQTSQAQSHAHPQSLDKQRWKDNGQPYQLPSVTSVMKVASAGSGHNSHLNSGNHSSMNVPGTSGSASMLSGHYHVNQHGQSVPKSTYPHDPNRYPQNYLKRPPPEDYSKMNAPTVPKQPRQDNWKATFDQQIEKRFNSYLSSKGIVNGDVSKTNAPSHGYPMPPAKSYMYEHYQQHQHQQHNFSAEKGVLHSSSSNSGSGNGAADKRVLSILRNSLETKEARLQQQMTKSPVHYTELTTRPPASMQQSYPQGHRHSLPAAQGVNAAVERGPPTAFPRLSIPKAVDSIQEPSKNITSYFGNSHLPPLHQQQQAQLHIPHHPSQQAHNLHRQPAAPLAKQPNEVVDITHEDDERAGARLTAQKLLNSQQQLAVNTNNQAATGSQIVSPVQTSGISSKTGGEYDGLAAFLAARIRTKAELKQQPSSEQPPTPSSSSLASASLSSSNFRSPYNDLVKTPGPTSDLHSSNSKCSPWNSNPHKAAKDQNLAASFPRRRLFSKSEEERPPSASDAEVPQVGVLAPTSASLPPRASSSHRSSSETSVFDFRESDSEGETPTLERQPGRRPSVSSIPNAVTPAAPSNYTSICFPQTALEKELKPEEDVTYDEWLTQVDDLIGQLEKDRLRRIKPFTKKSSRGGRGGGRGAIVADRAPPPILLADIAPQLTVIKQEIITDTEESFTAIQGSLASPSVSSVTIKEEALSESDTSLSIKDTSQTQVALDIKSEFKDRRCSKRGGRGRGRGGGPGSRGGTKKGGGGRTKKTVFGDGSDFKTPGWEEELYKFKKSIRMPSRLINISRPPGWPKPPLSLPDLEGFPDSPMTNDSVETFPGKSKPEKEEKKSDDTKTKEEDKRSIAKSLGEDQSFLNRLMAKYTARKKKIKKESPGKVESKPEEDVPGLLPTPSLHGSKDPSFLGFRKETIHEYRAEFLKTGTFTAEADLPPTVLETRTRTENKLFKERLTIKEVFGAERPASAPPPGTTTDDLRRRQRLRKCKLNEKKKRMMVRANKEKLQQNSGAAKKGTFRTFKRKLKSSGFDYIRKPKKKIIGPKKESDQTLKPRKKKVQPMTVEEIEETIKAWTLNKGVGETVLHKAAKSGLVDVVRYLLDKPDQDPSPRDNAGYTPLHEASSRGHVAVAQLLLNYGASVEDSALGGVRPLHEATENGFTKMVRLLLDYGADPLLATYSGATALSLAAADEESRLLMEHHISQNGSRASSVHNDISSVPTDTSLDVFEIEESDFALPTLYRLSGESRADSWVLFHELSPLIKIKSKESLGRSLKQDAGTIIRDIKLHDFFAKAHSRAIKSAPPTECPNKTQKLTLVKYTDEIKDLLGVETTVIPR